MCSVEPGCDALHSPVALVCVQEFITYFQSHPFNSLIEFHDPAKVGRITLLGFKHTVCPRATMVASQI